MGYLLKSINLLNILLAATAIAAAHYIVSPRINKEMKLPAPAVNIAQASAAAQKQKAESEPVRPPIDFMLIADQNLFNPERKIPVEKAEAPPPPPKPELILYGTLIEGNTRLAYVEDVKAPVTTPGRGKRMKVLKLGDMISDFKLTEIDPDKIVLVRGSEVMTVDLAESRGKRQNPGALATPAPETPNIRRRMPGR